MEKKYRINPNHLFKTINAQNASMTKEEAQTFMKKLIGEYKREESIWRGMDIETFNNKTFCDDDFKASPPKTKNDKASFSLRDEIIKQMEIKLNEFEVNKYGQCSPQQSNKISLFITESIFVLKCKLNNMNEDEQDAYVLEFFKKFTYCNAGLHARLLQFLRIENHNIEYTLKDKILKGLLNFRSALNTSLASEITQESSPLTSGSLDRLIRYIYHNNFQSDHMK